MAIITNRSRNWNHSQGRSLYSSLAIVDVSVAYDTDLKRLERIVEPAMSKLFLESQDLFLSPPQYYGVESLADSGIVLRFVVETNEVTIYRARRRLARDLKILFDEKGITIPFPQVVVHNGD